MEGGFNKLTQVPDPHGPISVDKLVAIPPHRQAGRNGVKLANSGPVMISFLS